MNLLYTLLQFLDLFWLFVTEEDDKQAVQTLDILLFGFFFLLYNLVCNEKMQNNTSLWDLLFTENPALTTALNPTGSVISLRLLGQIQGLRLTLCLSAPS